MRLWRAHGAVALAAALTLGLACVPALAPPPASVPEPAPPARPAEDESLFSRLQALSERAEAPDLGEDEAKALGTEIDGALGDFLAAAPEVQRSIRLQGAVERLTDRALQLELDANAVPETPGAEEGTPLETLLEETTFLPESDLRATLEAVRRAQAAVQVGIPVPTDNPQVLTYVNLYQNRYRNWFAATLERAAPYLPVMQRIFKDEGVPPDLVFLAAVESAFRPNAVSRAKAVGMWQFIAGTAKRYGLRVDYWEDQRLDPEMSARASARYLKDLYDLLGDWPLALSSYNAGEFKVLRSLQRSGKKTFWELKGTRYLRRETREYVPAILAAILLGTNPEAYGFTRPVAVPSATAAVSLDRALDLRLLARCADLPVETLQALNPSLKRLVTPPRPFTLRIPADRLDAFQAKLAAVPEEERLAVAVHTVAPGETLHSIAAKYKVPPSLIRTVNRLPQARVKQGMELAIPIGASAADPSLYAEERLQARRPQRICKVRKGDTLAAVAARTGVPVDRLRALNALSGDDLRPGQRLVLAGPTPSAQASETPAASGGTRVHHVQSGDTLYQLALRYGTTVDRLCRLNRISRGKTLHPGDSLLIPQ